MDYSDLTLRVPTAALQLSDMNKCLSGYPSVSVTVDGKVATIDGTLAIDDTLPDDLAAVLARYDIPYDLFIPTSCGESPSAEYRCRQDQDDLIEWPLGADGGPYVSLSALEQVLGSCLMRQPVLWVKGLAI